ncbi:sugar-binding transcriptional regulator [Bacillus shivajii]|uniref:sugar-binding transcriptional regulator n=1 Tax=Bacillus shivajii TaxID=1983719 RepID=UPI001CF9B390|nr:sugar-binding transcriptional regulator [Bacillus shivajii]UCZ52769.1 sugar-binding transcriptional regulator [Bacillus shivajii]
MDASKERISKIVKAAKLYYQLDYSQQQVAKELGVSRPSVSRLLQEAKEQGIVQIQIFDPYESEQKSAELIKEKYGLKECIVVNVPMFDDEVIKEYIGKKAGEYVHNIIQDGDIIGVTWGTTVYEVAKNVEAKRVNGVEVVQLNGGVSHSETNTYSSEVLHLLGNAFHSPPHFLPLPAVVDHLVVKKAIVEDRHIRRVLELGKKANIALFTVGDPNEDSTLVKAGYFTKDDLNKLYEKKAVADICSRFFDINGNICCDEIDSRTISIDLDELKEKETSLLAAGGRNKVEGIIGALNGKFANVLVTDQFTAQFLIDD